MLCAAFMLARRSAAASRMRAQRPACAGSSARRSNAAWRMASRHHRLKGDLASVQVKGVVREQWQYEVTGGNRIWYAIDDASTTLWITQAGPGHPRKTDRH